MNDIQQQALLSGLVFTNLRNTAPAGQDEQQQQQQQQQDKDEWLNAFRSIVLAELKKSMEFTFTPIPSVLARSSARIPTKKRDSKKVRQQVQLSGLALANRADIHGEAKWRVAHWPQLPAGRFYKGSSASVVVNHPDKSKGQIVVMLGGESMSSKRFSNSVFLLNVDDHEKVWREGPAMNEARSWVQPWYATVLYTRSAEKVY